jgi:hypothetical protein
MGLINDVSNIIQHYCYYILIYMIDFDSIKFVMW